MTHTYHKFDDITAQPNADISNLYNQGFVFTRQHKGSMDKVRSVRINLDKCELSSENKRILRKTDSIILDKKNLPFADYHWSIGKMAKDFYDTKFGIGTFSANKVKQVLTNPEESNFNALFTFTDKKKVIGYCILYETDSCIHYSYPFYDLEKSEKNMGMGMMVRAVKYAKENGKKYLYLGSAQRPTDTYKLQFKGMEWFDGETWSTDLDELKNILNAL